MLPGWDLHCRRRSLKPGKEHLPMQNSAHVPVQVCTGFVLGAAHMLWRFWAECNNSIPILLLPFCIQPAPQHSYNRFRESKLFQIMGAGTEPVVHLTLSHSLCRFQRGPNGSTRLDSWKRASYNEQHYWIRQYMIFLRITNSPFLIVWPTAVKRFLPLRVAIATAVPEARSRCSWRRQLDAKTCERDSSSTRTVYAWGGGGGVALLPTKRGGDGGGMGSAYDFKVSWILVLTFLWCLFASSI